MMSEVEVLTHIDYLIDMARAAGSVHAKPARAELAALRARADEAENMPQKIVDLVKQLPPIDQDDVDCISRSIVINQIEKLVNRKLDDDSLWFSGGEWQQALKNEAAPYLAEVTALRQAVNEAREVMNSITSGFGHFPSIDAWLAAHPAPEQVTP